MSKIGTLATVCLLLVGGALEAQRPSTLTKSYLGKQLPDFKAQKNAQSGTWINAPQNMSLKHVHGRPTLVCFTFLG